MCWRAPYNLYKIRLYNHYDSIPEWLDCHTIVFWCVTPDKNTVDILTRFRPVVSTVIYISGHWILGILQLDFWNPLALLLDFMNLGDLMPASLTG